MMRRDYMEDELEVTTKVREDDNKTEVTVTVSAAEVKEAIDAQFKQMAKYRIPGFRPGRAPRKILEQNFGGHDAVFGEITENLINDYTPLAIDQEDIMFITTPDFGEDVQNIVEGEDYTFTFAGKVKPQVELLTYDPVQISMPPETATDIEIDAQVEQLRTYYYNFEEVEGRAVQAGDYVSLNMKNTANGEEVQGLNSAERLIELGTGAMPADFEGELIGMKAGESKTFDYSIEGVSEYEYLGVDTIHAEVTLNAIKEKVYPELGDEFASRLGLENMDGLRNMLKEAIDKQKAEQLPILKEERCVRELAQRIHGAIPVAYTNFTRQEVLRDFYNQLQDQGVTMDQFLQQQGVTSEDFQKDVEEEAKELAEQTLALDALFAHLDIEVTEEDIRAEFEVAEDPEATYQQWKEAGRLIEIREGVRRRKATEWLIENAIVTDEDETEDED